jgi:hypothetical protein
MDSEEFEKFVMNSILPLYPHAKNKTGMCVMLKVDSGPGKMNLNLFAGLGIHLVPLHPQYNARDTRDQSIIWFF